MSACAGLFGSGSASWKEEVQLSDGRVIVVKRETVYVAGGDEWAINREGIKVNEHKLWFDDPGGSGKVIEWRSTKISPRTYPEFPLVFDVASGKPVIFSLVSISAACKVYSKYVYKNGGWVEEPLPERFEQHAANLLFGSQRNIPELVSLKEKRNRNSDVGYRRSASQAGPARKICD